MAKDVAERQRPLSMIVGPIVLALLVFSGPLKTNGLIPTLPIDLSILLAGLVVALAATSLVAMGPPSKNVFYIPALWTLLLISLIPYAGNNEYIETKTSNLLTITLVLALAPFFLLRHKRQQWWFICGVVVVALVTAAGAALMPAGGTDRFLSEGSNPIDFGRAMGAGALVVIVLALSRSALRNRTRVVMVLLGITMLAGMLAAGSRGPSVGIVAALFAVFIVAPGFRQRRARGIVMTAVLSGIALLWLAANEQGGFERIVASFAGSQGDVSNGRESLWSTGLRLIADNPFGIGLGGYSNHASNPYPHNLIIEVFVEFGWITGAVLLVLAAASLIRLARRATSPLMCVMFGLAVFATAAAVFSSDFNGNRLTWVMLVFVWALDGTNADEVRTGPTSVEPSELAADVR